MSAPDPVNEERLRRQRGRNWAIFLILAGVVVLIYAVTIVKIKLSHHL